MNVSEAAKTILAGELRNFSVSKNKREWDLSEKCYYLSIFKSSPKTYRLMRKTMTMPHESTLKDVMRCIKLTPGVSPFLISAIQKKTNHLPDSEKACIIMFDEIFINEGLFYNSETDEIEGYEDIGDGVRTDREADHALLFMARGINSDWKMPIGYFLINGTCPSTTLSELIPQVITAMKNIDIPTIASVSDQGPTNQGAISILRKKCDQGQYDSVYEVGGDIICHLWDVPHLLKSIRNNLLTSDLEIEPNKIASWIHLIEFFKLDEGLCKTSRLQYAHLVPVGRNKMRVNLAAQALSESTASGMKTFHLLSDGKLLPGCMPTVQCLLFFDKLFDSLNGPPTKEKKRKEFRIDVTEDSYHLRFWREARAKLEQFTFIRKSNRQRHKPPCLHGFVDNLKVMPRILQKSKMLGISTFKLRNSSQDPIENEFGGIRQSQGSNTDPTAPQFKSSLLTNLVQKVSTPSGRNSNCSDDGCSNVCTLEELIREELGPSAKRPLTLIRGERSNEPAELHAINKLTRQATSLTCATICSKIASAVGRCPSCVKSLLSDEDSSDFILQDSLNVSLDKPSAQFTNFFLLSQKYVDQNWKEFGSKPKIKMLISSELRHQNLLQWLDCEDHRISVEEMILNLVVTRIIYLKCKEFNDKKRAQKMRITRQILHKSTNVDKNYGLEDIQQSYVDKLIGKEGFDKSIITRLQSLDIPVSTSQYLESVIAEQGVAETSIIQVDDDCDVDEPPAKMQKIGEHDNSDKNIVLEASDNMSLLDLFESHSSDIVLPGSSQQILSTCTKDADAGPSNLSENRNQPSKHRLEDLTVIQLKALAKDKGVKGYSRLLKGPLIELLNKHNIF